MKIKGVYFDGVTSQSERCEVRVGSDEMLHFDGVDVQPVPLAEIALSTRIANTPRVIQLPGGASVESVDHKGLRGLEKHLREPAWIDIHRWESQLRFIVFAVAFIAVAVFVMIKWGIPGLSNSIAHKLPAHVATSMANGSMELLDESYFSPSKLEKNRRERIASLFRKYIPPETVFNYRVMFRASPLMGANAFALPDGTIVLTDDFVELADSDDELLSVLFHEIGHVEQRHSLRSAVSSAGVAAVLLWATGDLEVASGLIIAIPTLLVEAGYSRDFEREADEYSLQKMLDAGIEPVAFATIMEKLDRYGSAYCDSVSGAEEAAEDAAVSAEEGVAESNKGASEEGEDVPDICSEDTDDDAVRIVFDYLSTHPSSEERIEKFRRASLPEA
jgi:Zn-dependent protease with chaperone function